MQAILTSGLTKAFPSERGVFDLDLSVEAGQIFGFLGPNGSGKTTTIRLLLDYLRPDRGTASLFGLDARRDALMLRSRIGYLPAEYRLYEGMTGMGLLAYFAGFGPPGTLERAQRLAERLSLSLEGKIKHFSKGMKQKLALIQALMHDPDLLILDEPTDGFDPLIQEEFHRILNEVRSRGKTVFLSSHVLSEVEQICDRVGIIREGRLLAVESVEGLRAKPLRILRLTLAEEQEFSLPQATLRQKEGRKYVFSYAGRPQELLKVLSPLPLEDFTLEPARLDEIFREYYA